MNFAQKLNNIIQKNNSLVCVGLDPELQKLPSHSRGVHELFSFNKAIIDATHDLVCVYKPNIAFYEAYGIEGLEQLKKTILYIKKEYPQIPILMDAKRGDIGNTSRMYAKAMYEYWDVDSVTIHPNMGLDTILPYLEYKERLTILLIRTSNADAKMFQDLPVGSEPYFLAMAREIAKWDYPNLGIFVGATYPEELKKIRGIFPDKIFLSAGIGAQKGQIEAAVRAGIDKNGKGIMFNASRSIIYASSGKDFAEKARIAAEKLKLEINQYRMSSRT